VTRRILSRAAGLFLTLAAMHVAPTRRDLMAQGTPADSALQRAVRRQLDSLARDKSAPLYSKRAQARIDTLLRLHLRPAVVDPTPPPPPPPPATDTSLVARLLGPTLSITATAALGGDFARYDANFAQYSAVHWSATQGYWESCYYDCAWAYYAMWFRSGSTAATRNAEYLRRGHVAALSMRRDYWERQAAPYQYNQSDYWHMPMGVALHYLLTGDDSSRLGVAYTAQWVTAQHRLAEAAKMTTLARPGTYTQSPAHATFVDPLPVGSAENRFRGRGIQAAVLAHLVNGPKDGPANGFGAGGVVAVTPGTWCEVAGRWVDASLATQTPHGAYRDVTSGGAAKPFMDAILNDGLILYYQFCRADPRVVDAVKRNADYNWSNVWLGQGVVGGSTDPAQQGFAYYEFSYTSPVNPNWSGGRYVAGDLSLMMVNTWGWLYRTTGDAKYRTQGDAIFAGGVALGYLQGAKQFNQSYYGSWRYLGYRFAP
jgi:hypothetical protein